MDRYRKRNRKTYNQILKYNKNIKNLMRTIRKLNPRYICKRMHNKPLPQLNINWNKTKSKQFSQAENHAESFLFTVKL